MFAPHLRQLDQKASPELERLLPALISREICFLLALLASEPRGVQKGQDHTEEADPADDQLLEVSDHLIPRHTGSLSRRESMPGLLTVERCCRSCALKAVISYLKRVATWGWHGRHVYSGALLGVGLPVIVAVIHPSEFAFRLLGFFLQVLGVWIVWKGIRGTRDQFEVPGSWAETKAWLAGFPRFRGRTVVAVGAAAIGVSVGSARDTSGLSSPMGPRLSSVSTPSKRTFGRCVRI
jgi:hypothetical protein